MNFQTHCVVSERFIFIIHIINLHYKFCLCFLCSRCMTSCFNLDNKARQQLMGSNLQIKVRAVNKMFPTLVHKISVKSGQALPTMKQEKHLPIKLERHKTDTQEPQENLTKLDCPKVVKVWRPALVFITSQKTYKLKTNNKNYKSHCAVPENMHIPVIQPPSPPPKRDQNLLGVGLGFSKTKICEKSNWNFLRGEEF